MSDSSSNELIDFLAADPYARVVSANGIPADELISGLQKAIRRGHVEDALLIAREMYVSGEDLRNHLWSRLPIIAIEDVGDGSFGEVVTIEALHGVYRRVPGAWSDHWVIVAHAVRFLAESTKDRTTSEMAAVLAHEHELGRRPEIHDSAVDMHTVRGRAMGRGSAHYVEEGAVILNERPDRDRAYFDKWRQIAS